MYIAIVKAIMKLYISIIDMQKLWFNLLSHIFIVLAFFLSQSNVKFVYEANQMSVYISQKFHKKVYYRLSND